jgi:predicted  nucleic acid-binding Zn-ribbon protein
VYLSLFNTKTVEISNYAQEKKKIDSLSYVITNLQKEQIKLNNTLITYQTKIDSLNSQMDSTRQEILNIRKYYGKQIKDITNYTPSELDKFFTRRY